VIAYLKSRHSSLKWRAAEIVGTVVQNDSKAQESALKVGTLPLLFETFESGDEQVRKKAIYAVSALVRHSPSATVAFFELGGLGVIERGLQDTFGDVQTKIVFFLLNLLHENETLKEAVTKQGLVPNLVEKLGSPNLVLRENILAVLLLVATFQPALELLREPTTGLRSRLEALLERTKGLPKDQREAAEEETTRSRELLALCTAA